MNEGDIETIKRVCVSKDCEEKIKKAYADGVLAGQKQLAQTIDMVQSLTSGLKMGG